MNLLTGEVKTVAGSPLGFSVLSFDGSDDFAQAPAATYFTGDFTVMAWVYVRNYSSWSRVIDFGSGPNSDNIVLSLTNDVTGRPCLHIFNGGSNTNMTAPNQIPLNQWVHLAATLQGNIAKIYVDGVQVISGALNTPRSVNRTRCYIGRSNWNNALANAFMSDLSIWSFAKTVDDIQADKNARLIGNESGLVAYWPMSDQDSKLIDLGPGRLDATLFGNPTWMANAGPPIISGDGVGVAARFKTPRGITVGSDGKLYIADSTEHTIRKLDPATRLVTTYAGTRDVPGTVNGIGLAAKFNTPLGLEPYSNYIFVVSNEDRIRRIDLNNAEVTTFAGGGAGAVDGVGIAAKFNNPRGIAEADGVLYVSDYSNHTIRRIAIDTAQVTTLAGTAGVAGSVDGIGAEARFNTPNGVGVDDEGNVFVTEYNGRIIRKLSPVGSDNWKVTTVAGLYNTSGFVDGLGMASRFRYLSFMTKDGPYGFFFADRDNNCIRKLSLLPWVNLANTPPPITNLRTVNIAVRGGGVTAYKFKFDAEADWRSELPAGTDLFLENLDEGPHTVQVIGRGAINDWQPEAAPTKFAWTVDLTAPTAELANKPASSTLDDMTNILVGGDDVIIYKYKLQKMAGGIYPAAAYSSEFPVATPLALNNLAPGTYTLSVVGRDTAGNWQADAAATTHEWFVRPVYVTIYAGPAANTKGHVNAQWYSSTFYNIIGLAMANDGTLYILDYTNQAIRKMTPDGIVSTLAGPLDRTAGYRNGPGEEALFYQPHSLALSPDEAFLYVADYTNQVVRKVDTKTGETTTFAGTYGVAGYRDGAGSQALFYNPTGMAIWDGFLYIVNTSTHLIQRVNLSNAMVSTLAGANAAGFVDADGSAARFYHPYRAQAANGILYVSDRINYAVRTVDLNTGQVTTLAGIGLAGNINGPQDTATFQDPRGLGISTDYVYVADYGNHCIRRIDKVTGEVSTLAGSKTRAAGNTDGVGNQATFYYPFAICTDQEGNLYVSNFNEYSCVRKITFEPWVALADRPFPRSRQTSIDITVRGGGVSRYKFKLDTPSASGSWSASDFGMNVKISRSDLAAEGRYTLSAIGQGAVDEWQSKDKASVYSWVVDLTPPKVELSNLPSDPYWGASTFVTVSGDDVQQYKYVHVRPTGEMPATITYDVKAPIQLQNLEPGQHTIRVMGCDTAGNWQVDDPLSPYKATEFTFLVKPLYVTTVAGEGSAGTGDGKWYEAQFTDPRDLCIDLDGNLIVADGSAQQIRRINFTTNTVSTLHQITTGDAVAVDRNAAGDLFVGCGQAGTNIERIASSGAFLNTIVGFNGPFGVTYDFYGGRDRLFVLEYGAKGIQRVQPGTWAKVAVPVTGLLGPRGITVSSTTGMLLTAGFDSHHVMAVNPGDGVVTLLTGREKFSGSVDDIATAARFLSPSDVAIAPDGTVYIADSGNHAIRRLSTDGRVTTYTGTRGGAGDNEGTADGVLLDTPFAVVERDGDLFVADTGSQKIKCVSRFPRAMLRDTPPVITKQETAEITVGGGGVTAYRFLLERLGSGTILDQSAAEIAVSDPLKLKQKPDTHSAAGELINNPPGTYTLFVWAKGVANDWQATATVYTWGVDYRVIEPYAELMRTPASWTHGLTTDIITSGTAVVSYIQRLDGGAWTGITNISTPIVYQELPPGTHTLQVKGIDAYGNRQALTTDYTWYIAPTYVTTVGGSSQGYVNDKWYASKLYEPMGAAISGNELIFADRVNRAIRKLNLRTGMISTVVDSKWAILRFDGVDDYINLGNAPALQVTGDQTIEMWIRPSVMGDGVRRNFYDKAYGGEGTITLEPAGSLSYYYGTAGANAAPHGGWGSGDGTVKANVWTHIAVVRDLSATMRVTWYVNGQLKAGPWTAPYAAAVPSNNPLSLGKGYCNPYRGELAEVRLWNIPRTQQQIASDMARLLSGTEPGLVGYWPLYEGGGNLALDLSNNNNHGTIYGNPLWSDTEPPFSMQSGGLGSNLNLSAPYGLIVATGCAYFADYNRHVIYKTNLETKMTEVLAGTENEDGTADGVGMIARFRTPTALAFDGQDLFVTDYGNHTIRKVTFAGVVTTLAGVAGAPSLQDGTGAAARFNYPMGIAADRAGLLYIADSGNRRIRKMVSNTAVVTTLAGTSTLGRTDGASMTARFSLPVGVTAFDPATEPSYRVLVADGDGNTLRVVASDGAVITVAGLYGLAGNADGNGHTARFQQPFFMTSGEGNSFFVSDRNNNLLRKFSFQPRVALTNTPPLLTGANLDVQVQGGGITHYKYRIDGGAWGPETETSARINRNDLTDGNHTLQVVGKGFANYWNTVDLPEAHWQQDGVAETFQWSVDTIPPTVVLENTPSNPTQDRMASILASGTDVVQYRYRLDGSAYSDPIYPSVPIRLDNLAYGSHTIEAIGVDTAGNWQTVPTTYTWVVKPLYVSLVAGKIGSSGMANGKWYDAQFMEPSGLVQDAGSSNVYVIGGGNQTLRRFNASTMTVENYWSDTNIMPLFPEESLDFDGLNDYVSIPAHTAFNSPSVTVEMWFTLGYSPDTDANNNWRSLIRKGNTSSTPNGWDVTLEDNRTVHWDVGLGTTARLRADVGMTVGNPVHLAFVYDSTTGNQSVYANGLLATSTSRAAINIVANSEPINVARGTNEGQFPVGSGFAPGKFANIRIWNVARTQEQIAANMSRQLLGNETGLVGYWPLSMISGLITRDVWTGISGGAITDLLGNPRYPDNPDIREQLAAFDVPQTAPNIEYFGTRIYGWINPPQTGAYTFYLCTDDGGRLLLSTDGTPANKVKICGDTAAWGYKTWFANAAQKSQPIDLVAGRLYFIEGLQKENGGGDYIVVGWTGPGMVGTPQVISGSALSTYAFRDVTANGNHGTLTNGPTWVNGIEYRRFDTHGGIVQDGNSLYIAARDTHTIRKVDLITGNVTILAGEANTIGGSDGDAATTRFNMPTSLVKMGSYLYVTDFGNHTVRRVNYATGDTTTLAGQVGLRGYADSANPTDVRFSGPYGITTDGTYLYVTDAHNHIIRRLAQDGSTTTYAGQAKMLGNADGVLLSEAKFFYPTGITHDGNYLYLSNEGNHTIRRVDMNRNIVTTIAGKSSVSGNDEGIGVNATFNAPHYLTAVNGEPNAFFVSDNHTVRKIAPYPIATLKNLPDDPTNNTSVGIVVYGGGVNQYKYKVQRGSTLISDWSAWRDTSQPISLTTELAGQYTVTVRGKNTAYNDEQPEAYPTVFSWSKSANLALGKAAQQSSDNYASPNGVAAKAVDGNRDPVYANGSVTHTRLDAQAWWQVDLEQVSYINKVRLWNSDNVPSRLSNLYVLVSNEPFSTTNLWQTISQPAVESYYFAGTVGKPTEIDIERTGRYVRVQLVGSNYLSLAEVEVMESVPKHITAFRFDSLSPQVNGIINDKARTISLLVPSTTNLIGLAPTITHSGSSISPASGIVQDFTTPKTYTVTGEDGSTRSYVVTVSKDIVRNGLILDLDAESSTSYPGAGMVWYDRSGNGYDMTISGATFVPDRPMHFSFADNAGNKIYNSSFQGFAGLNDATVSMWVRYDSLATNGALISYAISSENNELLFWFAPPNLIGPHWNGALVNQAYPGLSAKVWHNITFTRNGTSCVFYFNGASIGTKASPGTILRGGGYFMLGQEQDSVGGNLDNNQDFPGDIATVQIYNRVLSADEILANYNAIKPRFEANATAKAITEFKLLNPPATGVIDETAKKITLTVPAGTVLTGLTPSVWHTGLSVTPKTAVAQDFTNPVLYTVMAADGTTAVYTVTVETDVVRDGLVLYLNAGKPLSYPGSGDTWFDLSGKSNNANLLNDPTYSANHGGGLVFDGVNDMCRSSLQVSTLAESFSVCAFFNSTVLDTSTFNRLVSADQTSGSTKWCIGAGTDGQFVFGGAGAAPRALKIPISLNQNYYVALAHNTNKYSMWLNGENKILNDTSNIGAPSFGNVSVASRPNTNGYLWTGSVYAVQIYNRVLTEQEVLQNYNALKSRCSIETKAVTEFKFADLNPVVTGLINESAKTITLVVPSGTNLTNLVPTITHNGASVSPTSGTPQDFTNPVTYTVSATGGSTADYTVRVERFYYDEGTNAAAYTVNWNNGTTYNMLQFGGLGNVTAHGPSGPAADVTYTLNLTSLPAHTQIRYRVFWHMIDSLDNETSYLYTTNSAGAETERARFTKSSSSAPAFSLLAPGTTQVWSGHKVYTYRPWANGANGGDGYAIIDTGFYDHALDTFSARHVMGANQGQADEAMYLSHVQVWIR